MDSPVTTPAADSPVCTLPPNRRAELDPTKSAVIANIRITSTTNLDFIIILNSDRLTQTNFANSAVDSWIVLQRLALLDG